LAVVVAEVAAVVAKMAVMQRIAMTTMTMTIFWFFAEEQLRMACLHDVDATGPLVSSLALPGIGAGGPLLGVPRRNLNKKG
jgi:hypothetical protein